MSLRRSLATFALLAPIVAGRVAAQGGAYGPLILRLPAGPRSLAMGNTGIVSRDDESIFFNPAQLTNATGFSASGEWLSSTAGTGALSAVTRFNGGGIGIGMRFANYELPQNFAPGTRDVMIEPGLTSAAALEATIGFAQTIKGLRVGAAGKYAEELTSTTRLGRPLLDLGVSKDILRVQLGLAVQNIGRDMDVGERVVDLPLRTTFGVGHTRQLGPYDLAVTGAVSLLRGDFVQPSGGAELNYSWLSGYNIALRAGARRSTLGEEPFTAGAGLSMDRLSVDYALETLSNQRVGHRFGLRIR